MRVQNLIKKKGYIMENNKTDIGTEQDIRLLVNEFYAKVRQSELIGPIFDGIIKDNWPAHLQKMYRFWGTVLLGFQTYEGHPFKPHAQLPVQQKHFDVWVGLWTATVDQYFQGRIADEAKWRGNMMAGVFLSRIQDYQNSNRIPLV